jgi:Na+-driven multidrug efflux pump
VLYQCYHLFGGKGIVKIYASYFKPDMELIRSVIGVAWPATFQFLIASGSWIFLTRLVAETGGTTASAGYQIAFRNFAFFMLPAWGLSNAAATLVGQNLGAKHIDRAEQSVMITLKYNVIFMACVMLLFLFCSPYIIGIFTQETAVADYGIQAMRIVGSGYIFYGIGMVMSQALNGAGDTRTPTIINLVGFWLFQIPLAYLLAKVFGFKSTGAFIAIPVAESLIAFLSWYFFRKGKWKTIQL